MAEAECEALVKSVRAKAKGEADAAASRIAELVSA